MVSFEQKYINFCQKHKLFDNREVIVAGVSGGVDSMVMLSLLLEYAEQFHINVVVVHFNHMLRGKKADDDQKMVETFCRERKIKFICQKADVVQFAKDNKISFEMAGRQLRYNFFEEVATEYKHSVIATAHILNDNTETLLMRIFKGTGLQGLCGIDFQRENIIRPMLFAEKKELYIYAKEHNIPFSDDHTNFENDCLRNVIRNEILPRIKKEINPNIDENLYNLSVTATEYSNFIKNNISEILDNIFYRQSSYEIVLKIDDLKDLDIVERKEVLLQTFRLLDSNIDSYPGFSTMEQIDNLLFTSDVGRYVKAYQNILIEIGRKFLYIVNLQKMNWQNIEISPGKIYPMEFFIFSSKFIKFEEFSAVNNLRNNEFIDADKITGGLVLRHWQEGDRFKPFGNKFSKKLSDFFIDEKVPRFKKQYIPILADDEKILWICGLRLSNEVRITKNTSNILEIRYEEIDNG